MDLIEYSKAGNPVLYFPGGTGPGRLAAEVFRAPRGVVVADSGWSEPMNPTHPFHFLEGRITDTIDPDGDVPAWRVGQSLLRPLFDVETQSAAWHEWMASGHRLGRATAAAAIRDDLGIQVTA